MHPVLLLDEVLRIILDHIDPDSSRPPALKTFYCLAAVCRAWKDPALDYLWTSLVSVDPLLALLPHVSALPRNALGNSDSAGRAVHCRMHRTIMCPPMLSHDFMPTLRGFEV
jgi:hypothetical protein